MIIGILREIKTEEYRVAMTPAGAEVMEHHGHRIIVEKNAGVGSGFDDGAYRAAGAEIAGTAAEVYKRSQMVMHVKEPQPSEYPLIRPGQILFTYFHLAANEALTRAMIKTRSVAIAYETIQKADGTLPLLIPMSEVAGRMAIQEGAKYLEMEYGGEGILLGGVPGVEPATVLVIGAGTVGAQAAKMACGLGAKVYLIDSCLERLRYLADVMPPNCFTLDLFAGHDPQADPGGGSRRRLGPHPRRQGPQARHPRHAQDDEEGGGPGGRRDRPGRLLRDLEAHDPQGSGLYGRRGHSLLRGQHAGRRRQDLDPGPDQRHPPLCGRNRRQGLEEGDAGKPRDQGRAPTSSGARSPSGGLPTPSA